MKSPSSCLSIALLFFVLCSVLQYVSGMDCKFGGNKNFVDVLNVNNPKSCPTLVDSRDEIYCCERSDGSLYCCDAEEFIKRASLGVVIPVAIVVIIVLLAACCLCCLCCPCCMLYKRRHNGTVYGRVQPPTTVVTVQQPQHAYPITPGAIPQPGVMPMPQQGGMPMPQPGGMPMPQPGMGYPPPGPYPDYGMQGQQLPQFQQQHQQPPPPYNVATANEGYVKQAPYNPNY